MVLGKLNFNEAILSINGGEQVTGPTNTAAVLIIVINSVYPKVKTRNDLNNYNM